jgi:hypothetical protein
MWTDDTNQTDETSETDRSNERDRPPVAVDFRGVRRVRAEFTTGAVPGHDVRGSAA